MKLITKNKSQVRNERHATSQVRRRYVSCRRKGIVTNHHRLKYNKKPWEYALCPPQWPRKNVRLHFHLSLRPPEVLHRLLVLCRHRSSSLSRWYCWIEVLAKSIGVRHILTINFSNSYRFGDVTVASQRTFEIELDKPSRARSIPVLMYIVPVDVHAFFGFKVLGGEQLCATNVTNRLVYRTVLSKSNEPFYSKDRWSVPLTRHVGHLHAKMKFPRFLPKITTAALWYAIVMRWLCIGFVFFSVLIFGPKPNFGIQICTFFSEFFSWLETQNFMRLCAIVSSPSFFDGYTSRHSQFRRCSN